MATAIKTDTGHAAEADAAASFHPADLGYPEHVPDWLTVGGAKVCTVCGRFPNGIYWGRAPGQPQLGADAEIDYLLSRRTEVL